MKTLFTEFKLKQYFNTLMRKTFFSSKIIFQNTSSHPPIESYPVDCLGFAKN